MKKYFPKVLVVSASFNAGDAVTMINLFSKFDKSELFLATPSKTPHIDYFSGSYFLGNKETRVAPVFKPFFKVAESKIMKGCNACDKPIKKAPESFKKKIYKKALSPFLHFWGVYDKRFNLSVSDDFRAWVKEIKPDIIYSPVSNGIILNFLLQCQTEFPAVKFVFHGFDDWFRPSYKVIFRNHYINRLDSLYRKLISKADLLLSTTEMMAEEYERRYNKKLITFHNPVDLSLFPERITSFDDGYIHITYIGKVSWHNAKAIRNMQEAISLYNKSSKSRVLLDVYSQTTPDNMAFFNIVEDENMRIYPPIPNTEVYSLLKKSHILFLPITVSKSVASFTRFSMSTKMGEYLASGVPMIYCGPKDIAMTKFVEYKNIALYTTKDGSQELYKLIDLCLSNVSLMSEMTGNGKKIAKRMFDKDIISSKFYNALNIII